MHDAWLACVLTVSGGRYQRWVRPASLARPAGRASVTSLADRQSVFHAQTNSFIALTDNVRWERLLRLQPTSLLRRLLRLQPPSLLHRPSTIEIDCADYTRTAQNQKRAIRRHSRSEGSFVISVSKGIIRLFIAA